MWASRRRVLAPVAVGLAFVSEPLIVLFVWKARLWGGDLLFHYPWMWIGEVLIGLGAIAFVLAKTQSAPGQTRGVG